MNQETRCLWRYLPVLDPSRFSRYARSAIEEEVFCIGTLLRKRTILFPVAVSLSTIIQHNTTIVMYYHRSSHNVFHTLTIRSSPHHRFRDIPLLGVNKLSYTGRIRLSFSVLEDQCCTSAMPELLDPRTSLSQSRSTFLVHALIVWRHWRAVEWAWLHSASHSTPQRQRKFSPVLSLLQP